MQSSLYRTDRCLHGNVISKPYRFFWATILASLLLVTSVYANTKTGIPEEVTPWMGVYIRQTSIGVIVQSVVPDTPAQSAGIRSGDTIVAIDGNRVVTTFDTIATIRKYQPGDHITLTLFRMNRVIKKELQLVAAPARDSKF
ncbi:MAG: PDZ domain-containing protein [Leptospiraceae bacterium]|nr:PDZ domain-containing protein [Leptospiraceae bacterium]